MTEKHKVVERAIGILTAVVNTSTGLAHPLDDARAKELFKALYRQSIPLEYQQVYDQAVKWNWPDRHAASLAQLAEKIGRGGRVQIKHPMNWGEPTVDRIFAELGINCEA